LLIVRFSVVDCQLGNQQFANSKIDSQQSPINNQQWTFANQRNQQSAVANRQWNSFSLAEPI
jgi:hypothetical protein